MSKKIYRKDIFQSVTKSKGRFFSIFSLMMIGAIALVGLKVTAPNMEQTAQDFIDLYRPFDLAVMAELGLDEEDQEELDAIQGAMVEYGYLTDLVPKGTQDAIRVFSVTEEISQYKVLSGNLPTTENEIALSQSMSDDYELNDIINFEQVEDGVLRRTSFKVVGFVASSEIWDTIAMGASSVGTGDLKGYAVTLPAAFDSEVYMMARLRYEDLETLSYNSAAYEDKVKEHQKELEALLADNHLGRLTRVKAEAQSQISDGEAEISTAEKKLADAKNQLSDGQEQVSDGQSQLEDALAQIAANEGRLLDSEEELNKAKIQLDQTGQLLADTKAQLDAAAQELTASKAQLDSTAQTLAASKAQLDASKATLDSKKSELDAAEFQLIEAKDQLDAHAAELATQKSQLDAGWQEMQTAQADLQAQMDALVASGEYLANHPEIQEAQSQLAVKEQELLAAQAQYDAGNQAYQAALAQYQEESAAFQEGKTQYEAGLADYQNGMAQYEAGQSQYEAGLAQYQAGQSEYATGLIQYESGLVQYQLGLERYQTGLAAFRSGQGQIDAAKDEVAKNQAELDKVKKELEDGQSDYDKESKDASSEIAKAKEDLNQAKTDLEQLEDPQYTSYTRTTFPGGSGYEMYGAATSSISAVGNVFPIVIYVVAAMVTFMTMTRFVDEERSNAGIFKALGYSNKDIIRKFVLYGLVASMAGTLVGILAGNFILSPMIGRIITSSKVIGDSHLYFYPLWTILAVILGLISAVLPAYLVARKELMEKPAQLLQAKPPVSGSTILLEKIGFVWKRLSFTHKVTARNIFRYKQRMLMTIFGVAGSVALLFGGLGIRSSISGLADTQFGEIIRYDILVAENSKASEEEKADLADLLDSDSISHKMPVTFEQLEEKIDGVEEAQAISLLIADQPEQIQDFVQLRHRASKKAIQLDDTGVILSEKLASLYDVKVGDRIPLTIEDQVVEARVSGISELYASHFVYMTAAYYETLSGESPVHNSYLLKARDQNSQAVQNVAADFLKLEAVEAVVQNTAVISQIATLVDSLESVMVILIVLSILLGVVILYNLTNINVAERIRELSTIKVLGFHNKEVTMYIYRETIVLSIVGILLGLLSGIGLHRLLLSMIGPDNMMFQPQVTWEVYLIPVLAIVGILAVLGWLVNYKLRHVDMLEALKSVE